MRIWWLSIVVAFGLISASGVRGEEARRDGGFQQPAAAAPRTDETAPRAGEAVAPLPSAPLSTGASDGEIDGGHARRPPVAFHSSSNRLRKLLPSGAFTSMGGSLAAVLGLFVLMVWLLRRGSPAGSGALPGEVFETLGRVNLSGKQQAQLVRCGAKLLLVCITPGASVQTLTEITDPDEVERLCMLCQARRGGAAFRRVFEQMRNKPAASGRRQPGDDVDIKNLAALSAAGWGGDRA